MGNRQTKSQAGLTPFPSESNSKNEKGVQAQVNFNSQNQTTIAITWKPGVNRSGQHTNEANVCKFTNTHNEHKQQPQLRPVVDDRKRLLCAERLSITYPCLQSRSRKFVSVKPIHAYHFSGLYDNRYGIRSERSDLVEIESTNDFHLSRSHHPKEKNNTNAIDCDSESIFSTEPLHLEQSDKRTQYIAKVATQMKPFNSPNSIANSSSLGISTGMYDEVQPSFLKEPNHEKLNVSPSASVKYVNLTHDKHENEDTNHITDHWLAEPLWKKLCSLENITSLLDSLKSELTVEYQHHRQLAKNYNKKIELVKEMNQRLNTIRSIGLKLKIANSGFITESLRHKILHTEVNQLIMKVENQRNSLANSQDELQMLHGERNTLLRQKLQATRLYRQVKIETQLANQQLVKVGTNCTQLSVFEGEVCRLRRFRETASIKVGKLQSIVHLKSTPHTSCLQYVSSKAVIFTPPLENTNELNKPKENRSVMCKMSHIVPIGECSPLHIYQKLKTSIDTVIDGQNYTILATGPKNSGKTMNLFGDNQRAYSDLESKSPVAQLNSYDLPLDNENVVIDLLRNSPNELLKSPAFGTNYGLLGLLLIHFLQYSHPQRSKPNYLAILHTKQDSKITVWISMLGIPLRRKTEWVDYLKEWPNDLYAVDDSTDKPREKQITNISDVINCCKVANMQNCENINSRDPIPVHKAVVIRVESAYYSIKRPSHRHVSSAYLTLLDTIGLECMPIMKENQSAVTHHKRNCMRAWKDVVSLIQAFRLENSQSPLKSIVQNPVFGSSSSLNRLLRFYHERQQRSPESHAKDHDCNNSLALLLHLPCEIDQWHSTMHCLRLGLWLHLPQYDQSTMTHGMVGVVSHSGNKSRSNTCIWKIGHVGSKKRKLSEK